MRYVSLFLLALLVSACAGSRRPAGPAAGRASESMGRALGANVEPARGGVQFPLEEGTMRVAFCGERVAHVTVAPADTLAAKPTLVVDGCDAPGDVRTTRRGDSLVVQTDSAAVVVDRQTGALVVRNAAGTALVEALAPGDAAFTPKEVSDGPAWTVRQRFALTPDEGVYGLGEYQDGVMNWRGEDVLLAQANTMAAIPFLVSTRGYGILWDAFSASRFHDEDGGPAWFQADVADQIDYYVVAGRTPADAVAGYRRLTGKAPMYAKWAYGYWQSKERYRTGDELLSVAEEYRERGLPLDNLVQDWSYWPDPQHFSGMVWDSTRYPHPARTIETLHRQYDVQLMVSLWPAVGTQAGVYRALERQGHLFEKPHWAPARVYDAYSPEARETYWRYARQAFFDKGVDAWWMDGTEPEFQSTDDRYITKRSLLDNGPNALGAQARYLNTYALLHTGGLARHLRQAAPHKRPFILARSAFAGQQRNAATLWSGDIWASWGTFQNQIAAGLNVEMAGLPYWTTDIGAFLTKNRFPDGLDDPAYRELYVRWFQFGAVSPIFRAHGTHIPREIWQFGDPGDPAYDALARADRMRYRLLPYLYSTAWDVYEHDAPFLRPLPFAFPGDPEGYDDAGSFLFGKSLLASPVTKAMQHPPRQIQEFIPTRNILNPSGTAPGMKQQFFYGTNLAHPAATNRSEIFNLTWKGSLPPEVTDSSYSIRYDGRLKTEAAGTYTFVLSTDSGTRLSIGGRAVLDQWNQEATGEATGTEDPWAQGTPRTERATVDLPAHARVPVRLEYRQPTPNAAHLVLEWITPTREEQTVASSSAWPTYLPAGTGWVNFWTGAAHAGGAVDTMDAPLDRLPLYARAGTILPLGPRQQYTGQKAADTLDVRVYPGADGTFTLFEDAGDGTGYRDGEDYTLIPFRWDDDAGTLTIGERKGTFDGMIDERTFRIVWVKPGHGVGIASTPRPDRVVRYDGTRQTVQR